MKLSAFFNKIEIYENVIAIFNSILLDVVFVSNIELVEIESLTFKDPELLNILVRKGIIVSSYENDIKALEILRRDFIPETGKISVLYLITTTDCNLSCKYCFVNNYPGNNCEVEYMSEETISIALDKFEIYLAEHSINEGTVILYGGEPTLNWEVLRKVVDRSLNSSFKLILVTNGTTLCEERICFLAKSHVEIGLSLDGPVDINDANRIFKNSLKGSYEAVVKNIQLLKKYNADFGLSVTVSHSVLQDKEKILHWLEDIGVENIFFNLLHFSNKEDDWESYQIRACDFLIEAFERLSPKGILDGRMLRKLDSFFNNKFRFVDCAACGAAQLTIKPNGNICICQCCSKTTAYEFGNIFTTRFSDVLEKVELKFWKESITLLRDKCVNCEAIFLCGGGCPMQSEALFGDRSQIDETACIHSKSSLKWILKKSYEIMERRKQYEGIR